MNWGRIIIVILTVFVLFIGGLCMYMLSAPEDDYDHQYYEKGLAFNHDYNREKQVYTDHAQPLIDILSKSIKLTFAAPVNGKITFVRPSSSAADKTYPLNSGAANVVEIATQPIAAGKWQLVFEWTSNKKEYLYQQEIFIK